MHKNVLVKRQQNVFSYVFYTRNKFKMKTYRKCNEIERYREIIVIYHYEHITHLQEQSKTKHNTDYMLICI